MNGIALCAVLMLDPFGVEPLPDVFGASGVNVDTCQCGQTCECVNCTCANCPHLVKAEEHTEQAAALVKGTAPAGYYFNQFACPTCKATDPAAAALAKLGGIEVVSTDERPDLAHRYRVTGTPAFVRLYPDGTFDRRQGVMSDATMLRFYAKTEAMPAPVVGASAGVPAKARRVAAGSPPVETGAAVIALPAQSAAPVYSHGIPLNPGETLLAIDGVPVAQSAPQPQKAMAWAEPVRRTAGWHTHVCRGCGNSWSHGEESAGNNAAHTCGSCGRLQWN
jgi:thiol-disulfide isomerase/thioredoxin